MNRCSFPEAMQKLAGHYCMQNGANSKDFPQPDIVTQPQAADGRSQDELPIPADTVRKGLSRKGLRAVAEFVYGANLRKVRFEHEFARQTGKDRASKEFRWEHLHDGIWLSGDGGLPKPLYVNRAFRERDQVGLAIGFEGEAKTDLAGELGFTAFSFKDITIEQAATLADCNVVLWRDNDASGKGQVDSAARVIFDAAQARTIKLLTPPAEFPIAADIIDAVNDLNWDRARIARFLETAKPFANDENCQGIHTKNNRASVSRSEHEAHVVVTDWPELIPLSGPKPDLIPLTCIPGWLGEMAQAIAESIETPFDLAALLGTAVVSSCIAAKAEISPETGYTEPLNTFVCPAMESGNRKTAVSNRLIAPLAEWERMEIERIEPEQKQRLSERRTMEGRIERLRKKPHPLTIPGH